MIRYQKQNPGFGVEKDLQSDLVDQNVHAGK